MPQMKLIITLNNSEDAPEDIRMHVAAEADSNATTDTELSESEYVLHETALLLCDSLMQLLQGESAAEEQEDTNVIEFLGKATTGNA